MLCHRLHVFAGLACAIAACFAGHRALAMSADDCLPKFRTELNISSTERPVVLLTINGLMARVILDTGAERSSLTEAAAQRLGLVSGGAAAGEVKPGMVAGGGRPLPGISFVVVATTLPKIDNQPIDGVLGADALSAYEVDLNLGRHLVLLYDPSPCDVPTLPWRRPFEEVAAQFSSHRHLAFPVTLDGQKITAFIDTGARVSMVNAAVDSRLGITDTDLAQDQPLWAKDPPPEEANAKKHKFVRLVVAGSALLAPMFGVMPLRLTDAEMRMGLDVLSRERIWLSYATHRVFVERPG